MEYLPAQNQGASSSESLDVAGTAWASLREPPPVGDLQVVWHGRRTGSLDSSSDIAALNSLKVEFTKAFPDAVRRLGEAALSAH